MLAALALSAFLQHGPGLKHMPDNRLAGATWQQAIIEAAIRVRSCDGR